MAHKCGHGRYDRSRAFASASGAVLAARPTSGRDGRSPIHVLLGVRISGTGEGPGTDLRPTATARKRAPPAVAGTRATAGAAATASPAHEERRIGRLSRLRGI